MAVLILSPGGGRGGESADCYFSRPARFSPRLVPPLLLTLNSDPSAGDPSLGKREVEKAREKKKMWGKSVTRAEQEEWGSHGQGLINEPLI